MLALDQIQTVALAGLVLFVGYGVRRLIPFLETYNIPAPVVGGLLMAMFITISRNWNWSPFTFTTTLQAPLMIAFFTTIGFGASLSLLRVGGPAVILFLSRSRSASSVYFFAAVAFGFFFARVAGFFSVILFALPGR